jgi:Leucine-rich repeat (LRR) protein
LLYRYARQKKFVCNTTTLLPFVNKRTRTFIMGQSLKSTGSGIEIVCTDLDSPIAEAIEQFSQNDLLRHSGTLDCSYAHLHELPESVKKYFQDAIAHADNGYAPITHVSLYDNRFSELPMSLLVDLYDAKLLHLKVIDISFNKLTGSLPKELGKLCEDAEKLVIQGNRITSFPTSMRLAACLSHLDLCGNHIDIETLSFDYWPLRTLLLSDCGLSHLPDTIFRGSTLHTLDLSRNRIDSLNCELYTLAHLTELNLTDNSLSRIPGRLLQNTPRLKTLKVSKNHIRNIPDELFRCNSLEYLNMSFNDLEVVSEKIGNLFALVAIHLAHNKLRNLPEAMSTLENVRILDVSHNQLHHLFSLRNYFNLTDLNITSNQISDLSHIEYCGSLTHLFAGYNLLTEFDWSGNICTNALKQLVLSGNLISDISSSLVDHLVNLNVLCLGQNKLKNIPFRLHALRKLKYVNLSMNHINNLRDNQVWFSLKKASSLISLDLSMNELNDIENLATLQTMRAFEKLVPVPEIQLYLNGSAELDKREFSNFAMDQSRKDHCLAGYAHTIGTYNKITN